MLFFASYNINSLFFEIKKKHQHKLVAVWHKFISFLTMLIDTHSHLYAKDFENDFFGSSRKSQGKQGG